MVEILAHHYSQTKRADKALAYLAMAGEKSLGVYSIDEASTYFAAALALLDKDPDCASDEQVTEFISSYALLLNLSGQINVTIGVLGRYLTRIDQQGDDPRVLLIRYHYAHALLLNARYGRSGGHAARSFFTGGAFGGWQIKSLRVCWRYLPRNHRRIKAPTRFRTT